MFINVPDGKVNRVMEETVQANPDVAAADNHNGKTQTGYVQVKWTCKKNVQIMQDLFV
jgi:DNA-binding protein YbaB